MRTDVFQVVALGCHANAYLAGAFEHCPELNQNSTLAPVHEIDFERIAGGKLGSGIVADAVGPWLRRLRKEGVERVGISIMSCPFDPLVVPDEPWGILTDGDVGVEIWSPTWRKRIRSHGDASPWRVTYTASRAGRWATASPYAPSDIERLLTFALQQCSSANPLIERLSSGGEDPFPDMFPVGWPSERAHVGRLAARIGALLRSEDWCTLVARREMSATEYEQVSLKLWKASLMALETAARFEAALSEHPTSQNLPLAG
jgi:hypothetical protein